MAAKRKATIDPELQRIDDLEAAMVRAPDEKHTLQHGTQRGLVKTRLAKRD